MLGRWAACLGGLLTLTSTLGACSNEEHPTQVIVVFDAPEAMRPRIASVHVDVLDGEGVEVGETDFALSDPASELPLFGLRLIPRGEDATRRFRLRAEAFDDAGGTLGSQSVEGSYVEGEVREVWIVFDESCEGVTCPDGFRCQEARCVEECVEATPAGGVTRSLARACGEPCAAPSCAGEVIAACEDGALVVERECLLGCADANACNEVVASNLDRVIGAAGAELDDLRVPGDEWAYFDQNGEILSNGGPTIRGEGDLVNGIRFQTVSVGAQRYDVVEVRDLIIERGATLALAGSPRPFIFIVHGEAIIEGRLQASGRAGARGGGPGDGPGPGGGTGGTSGAMGTGGGAGGSYGSAGGAGGSGGADAPGGVTSPVYGTPELIPLLPGSGGGGAPGGTTGGRSGGAVQITARERIRLGPESEIMARGSRGDTAGGGAGAGGGSGGSILLEAPIVIVESGSGDRVQAYGADGGRGNDGMGQEVERGDGSSSSAPAMSGQDGMFAGGGGGGAGRVRINNTDGAGFEIYEDEITPTGASVFSVGQVSRASPQ